MLANRAAVTLLLAAVVSACATSAPTKEAQVTPSEPTAGCDVAAAGFTVGKPWTAELAEQARAASGAATLRTIRHGDMVTMDYVADRLNLELDEAGKVASVRCG